MKVSKKQKNALIKVLEEDVEDCLILTMDDPYSGLDVEIDMDNLSTLALRIIKVVEEGGR